MGLLCACFQHKGRTTELLTAHLGQNGTSGITVGQAIRPHWDAAVTALPSARQATGAKSQSTTNSGVHGMTLCSSWSCRVPTGVSSRRVAVARAGAVWTAAWACEHIVE